MEGDPVTRDPARLSLYEGWWFTLSLLSPNMMMRMMKMRTMRSRKVTMTATMADNRGGKLKNLFHFFRDLNLIFKETVAQAYL